MADDKKTGEKTIEMRLAELEDKLAKIHITEDELKAYHKVSSLIAGTGAVAEGPAVASTMSPTVCAIFQCVIPRQVAVNRGITPRINRGINECNECGPCAQGGGGFGGGFGGFGM